MSIRLTTIILPALACLVLAVPAVAAEARKATGVKPDVKAGIAKPGPGTGADEHGCIPPQTWYAPAKACVTDVLPDKPKGNQTMKKSEAAPAGAMPGKKHNHVGHVTLLR